MAGFTVEIKPGQEVVVKAVSTRIEPPSFGTREDQRPAFEELERYVQRHSDQIRNLAGGRFEDDADLATEGDAHQLIEILSQFHITSEEVLAETKKILTRAGLSERQARLRAQAFSDFLAGFGRETPRGE